jgi:CBS domain-containing protein
MKVSDLHQQRLFTAEADETLDEAADRMRWHAIGALPVFDARHNLVGIITERDLTAAVADGANTAVTQVAEYMTPTPAVLGPGSELAEAARAMLELGVRHLPVVDNGRLVAVLSMRDVLDAEAPARSGG